MQRTMVPLSCTKSCFMHMGEGWRHTIGSKSR
jgi:hypothetical protein